MMDSATSMSDINLKSKSDDSKSIYVEVDWFFYQQPPQKQDPIYSRGTSTIPIQHKSTYPRI